MSINLILKCILCNLLGISVAFKKIVFCNRLLKIHRSEKLNVDFRYRETQKRIAECEKRIAYGAPGWFADKERLIELQKTLNLCLARSDILLESKGITF